MKQDKDQSKYHFLKSISPGGIEHYDIGLWQDVIYTLVAIEDEGVNTKLPVFIGGPSGTGKTTFARDVIHNLIFKDNSKGRPFVEVNCASLQDTIIASEIFGHVKGAYTNATRDKAGAIEKAGNGVLFLDEIGKLNYEGQQKLLQLTSTGYYSKVGSCDEKHSNAIIVVGTSENIKQRCNDKLFHPELYYRISRREIFLPSLNVRYKNMFTISKAIWKKNYNDKPFPYLLGEILRKIAASVFEISEEYFDIHKQKTQELNILPGGLWELEKILELFYQCQRLDLGEAYEKVHQYLYQKDFGLEYKLAKDNCPPSINYLDALNEYWQLKVLSPYYKMVDILFSPDYSWWFIKPFTKTLPSERGKLLKAHEKEWHPNGQPIIEVEHPTGWWDGTLEEVKTQYCKLRVEYNVLFKGLSTKKENAKDIGIESHTLAKYLKCNPTS